MAAACAACCAQAWENAHFIHPHFIWKGYSTTGFLTKGFDWRLAGHLRDMPVPES